MRPELKPLFVAHRIDQDGLAVLAQFHDLQPQLLTDSRRDPSDEYSGGNLQQPPSQVAAQPCRAIGENEDYHSMSHSPSE